MQPDRSANNTFPVQLRIKKNSDFQDILQKGTKYYGEYFIAFALKNDELKVGFTTSKDFPNKPKRNRLKRIMKEIWRTHFRDYDFSSKIIFLAKHSSLGIAYDDLLNDFMRLLKLLARNRV